MLVEIFIFFEIIVIAMFIVSFFTHQEVLWAITAILSAVLMMTSYHIEYYIYQFNITTSAYTAVMVTFNYPYLFAINMIFFALSLALGLFDMFDKYGAKSKIGQ